MKPIELSKKEIELVIEALRYFVCCDYGAINAESWDSAIELKTKLLKILNWQEPPDY